MLALQTFLLSFALLAERTISHPNPPPDPSTLPAFIVDQLNIFEPSGRPGNVNLYRVAFDVTDPSDSNAKATCETFWDYADAATGWPHNYVRAKKHYVRVRI
jgi:hypothetical protein